MKYTPKAPDESINRSHEHPLREVLRLGVAVLIIVTALYFATGFAVDQIVDRLDPDTGIELRPQMIETMQAQFGETLDTDAATYTRELFNQLIEQSGRSAQRYHLMILDDDMVNAMALPGGVIVVLRGLLDDVESENELAMVLGHELGHLDNRDHLRAVGRSIILAGLQALAFGNSGGLDAQLIGVPTNAAQLQYGRKRELAADRLGLAIVCDYYGHSGGAEDFFARNIKDDASISSIAWFASHPASKLRVDTLRELARELGCSTGTPTPWAQN